MHLNKFLPQAGVCSRRKATDAIKAGEVKVNGIIVKEPWYEVKPKDVVSINGHAVHLTQKYAYILLNKPKNCITTLSDEKGRETVLDLLVGVKERVFPIGRLDRNTTGVLLLTNDGEFANKLMHPRYEVQKVYTATLDKPLVITDLEKIKQGVQLPDGLIKVDYVGFVTEKNKSVVRVKLHSGKYRVVRRLFNKVGYEVKKLDRISFAGLTKKGLPAGAWRYLTSKEIKALKEKTI